MVRAYVADGASPVVKCGAILQARFPNMVLVVRVRGHAARRSCQIPVTHADVFCDLWKDVFDAKHALVPCIQNSHAWRLRLQKAQRWVMGRSVGAAQGGGLGKVLKHFSFAKQRFDSAACPA